MIHQVEHSYEKTWNRIHHWKISMCTYVKKLTNISQIYEYIEIHVINIYNTKNMGKYVLS